MLWEADSNSTRHQHFRCLQINKNKLSCTRNELKIPQQGVIKIKTCYKLEQREYSDKSNNYHDGMFTYCGENMEIVYLLIELWAQIYL